MLSPEDDKLKQRESDVQFHAVERRIIYIHVYGVAHCRTTLYWRPLVSSWCATSKLRNIEIIWDFGDPVATLLIFIWH